MNPPEWVWAPTDALRMHRGDYHARRTCAMITGTIQQVDTARVKCDAQAIRDRMIFGLEHTPCE